MWRRFELAGAATLGLLGAHSRFLPAAHTHRENQSQLPLHPSRLTDTHTDDCTAHSCGNLLVVEQVTHGQVTQHNQGPYGDMCVWLHMGAGHTNNTPYTQLQKHDNTITYELTQPHTSRTLYQEFYGCVIQMEALGS